MINFQQKLGPGTLADPNQSPFKIPFEQWKQVDDYVKQLCAIEPAIVSKSTGVFPAFGDLHTFALKWKTSSFRTMIELAHSIDRYGSQDVTLRYGQLTTILDTVKKGNAQPDTIAAFEQTIATCIAEAQVRLDQSTTVTEDAARFASAIELAHNQMKSQGQSRPQARNYNPIEEIMQMAQMISRMAALVAGLQTSPIKVVQKIKGIWLAIKADLESVRERIDTEITILDPIDAKLGVRVAIDEWLKIAQEARHFASEASRLS